MSATLNQSTSGKAGVIKFRGDLMKFALIKDAAVATVAKVLTIKLHQLITMETPVDTGRARASWNVALNEPNLEVPPDIPVEDKRARERARRNGETPGPHPMFEQAATQTPSEPDVIKEIDGTQKIFITSNLPYIKPLEDGHSGQAPHGMVAINVAAMETTVMAAIEAARRAGAFPV
jgi:hypothetical protein